MASPLISFLMPTFNRADRIRLAVETVLRQTYSNVELVIYDDGSEDETEHEIRRIKDPRVRFERTAVNAGVAKARNALLDLARGEYACWLDSDDRSNIFRAEISLACWERYQPGYIRTAQMTFGKPTDNTWRRHPILVFRGGVCFGSIMFRPTDAPRFDEGFTCCFEDMDWETQLATRVPNARFIPLTLYNIGRRSPGRLTMRYKLEEYEATFKESAKRRKVKLHKAIQAMEAKGGWRKPLTVDWDFVAPYLEQFYGRAFKALRT